MANWVILSAPNLYASHRQAARVKMCHIPPNAKLGSWAFKRMVAGESGLNQFGDIQKNIIQQHPPSGIWVTLNTPTCLRQVCFGSREHC